MERIKNQPQIRRIDTNKEEKLVKFFVSVAEKSKTGDAPDY